MRVLGRSVSEVGYLELLLAREQLRQDVLVEMANKKLDTLVYATFDHQPIVIPADATTRTVLDSSGPGNNRRLSPVLGFPALTVPAGFTADGLPVGLEFMSRGIQRAAALQARVCLRAGDTASQASHDNSSAERDGQGSITRRSILKPT